MRIRNPDLFLSRQMRNRICGAYVKDYLKIMIIFCRYVIVKHVRRDHLDDLPVPNRIKQYLNTPFYYSEQVI